MKLQPLMTVQATIKPPFEVGNGPFGTRAIFPATGGHFTGERLRGTVLPGGADWFLANRDGYGRLDVRITLQTDDGAHIYTHYRGILSMNEKVQQALKHGGSTDYGDSYFMIQPNFETGDERYHWLNRVMAVAEGRIQPNEAEYVIVEYRVYELVNG